MNKPRKTLVTGAGGFVGSALMSRLHASDAPVTGVTRAPSFQPDCVQGPSLETTDDWSELLDGVDTVVHAAARVHVMQDAAADPLQVFRAVNTQGTLHLAQQAARAGVRRFILLSSIKVNGEETVAGRPFTAEDAPAPRDAYGVSKAEAESGLKALAAETGMEYVIIRPPLVYGPGVKGNFAALVRAVRLGLPLPLGAVTGNRRSLVALDTLVDLIVTCIAHPAAANRTLLVSDDEDLSTADLLRRLAAAMNRPLRLPRIPLPILETIAAIAGRKVHAQRLFGNLQLDIGPTRQALGWTPPVSVDEGLRRAARDGMQ